MAPKQTDTKRAKTPYSRYVPGITPPWTPKGHPQNDPLSGPLEMALSQVRGPLETTKYLLNALYVV